MSLMHGWKALDRILRGEATRPLSLRQGSVEVPVVGLTVVLVFLGMVYGLCMGCFAVFRGSQWALMQVAASVLKVPALFFLTLAVTFPSLYVFNALVGSRLSVRALLGLLVAALGVTIAVLSSLGPIVAFFSASTTSYPFMQLLNVAVFGASGLLGMTFLLQTLHRLSLVAPEPTVAGSPRPGPAAGPEALEAVEKPEDPVELRPREPGALEAVDDRVLRRHVRAVFRCWVVLFGLVGAQMGWVLRPFIGSPDLPFTWFRERQSNIFLAVLQALGELFTG